MVMTYIDYVYAIGIRLLPPAIAFHDIDDIETKPYPLSHPITAYAIIAIFDCWMLSRVIVMRDDNSVSSDPGYRCYCSRFLESI